MMTRDRETRESAQVEASSENRKNSQTLTIPNFKVYKVCWLFRIHRGAAAVEFAIVAPVFMLLLFGMIEFGRMVMVQQMLTNATCKGQRSVVLEGIVTADVNTAVQDYATSGGIAIADSEITVSPNAGTADIGDPNRVSVEIPFRHVSWLPAPMF